MEGPQNILGVRNLLEGLTELRTVLMVMVMVCCSERYRLKSAKRMGPWDRVQERPVFSQWRHVDSTRFSRNDE